MTYLIYAASYLLAHLLTYSIWLRRRPAFSREPVILLFHAGSVVLLMSAVAYAILARVLIRLHGEHSTLAHAIGSDRKGKVSMAIYAAAIVLAFASQWFALGLYVCVAILWFIPDRRIERVLEE